MLDERAATVFVHPTSPCCFEAFGLELPAPMIEFPFDTTRTALSLLYSGALTRHPRINFILPHAGGTLPFLAPRIAAIGSTPVLGERAVALPDAIQALARFFYDTALSVMPQQIAALRALAPISQIVYGTDYPFANEARAHGRRGLRYSRACATGAGDGPPPQRDAVVRPVRCTLLRRRHPSLKRSGELHMSAIPELVVDLYSDDTLTHTNARYRGNNQRGVFGTSTTSQTVRNASSTPSRRWLGLALSMCPIKCL